MADDTEQQTSDGTTYAVEWLRQVVEGINGGDEALKVNAPLILAELDRLAAMEQAAKSMKAELIETYLDAFHEIASDAGDGWYCTNARGTCVGHGDRLVELGVFETDESRGCGRVQYYRRVQPAELEQAVEPTPAMVLGWAWAEACATLDLGLDPRDTTMPDLLERMAHDFAAESASKVGGE